jgi:membrane fusion protein (multidrug efflux system)
MLKQLASSDLRPAGDDEAPAPGRVLPPALTEARAPHVVPRPTEPARRLAETSPIETASEAADALPPSPPRRRGVRRLILGTLAVLGLALGAWYGHYWWTVGRFIVSTDNAYVGAHSATLAAKVSGYVASVDVRDNAQVRTGDVIARIDNGDYKLAVRSARDNIAIERATIDRIGKQVTAQEAAVSQAKAQLTSAKAAARRAELELKRQQRLAEHEFASHQALEQAQSSRDQTAAGVQGAEAGVAAAQTNVAVLKAQQQEAVNTLQHLQTALARAERDLSFTVIRAPFDGVIGNRGMQVGDYVQPGQRLASLVPLSDVYVDANFKETQLAGLRVGQSATVAVDALPDHNIKGSVVSVAPASGSVFSLLPPDNATGNFTKIVQRIPVRIRVPAAVAGKELLRPGMSVVVSVDTKPDAAGNAPDRAIGSIN